MQKEDLKIQYIDPLLLHPCEYNPRYMTEDDAKQLRESIIRFGFVDPLIVNNFIGRENMVIGGHQRLIIAKELGLGSVPVVYVNLDEKKERELNLRLNRNQGRWDIHMLANFDGSALKDVGFESKELDNIFREKKSPDDFNSEKALAEIVTPDSKPLMLYQLGRHRLLCGDATNAEHWQQLMGGALADVVFTDPPYNVNYSGKGANTSNTILNDDLSELAFRNFLKAAFQNIVKNTKGDAPMYCCYADLKHREFEDSLNDVGFFVRNKIIWVKKLASWGFGDYRWKHEPILYCVKDGSKTSFYGDRKQYTEWTEELSDAELLTAVKKLITKDEAGGSTVWRLSREQHYDHPTQKPLKLIEIAIKNSSKRDDIVVDPFGGSGSTLIASEELDRTAYIMELDPKYCDVIRKRWEQYGRDK